MSVYAFTGTIESIVLVEEGKTLRTIVKPPPVVKAPDPPPAPIPQPKSGGVGYGGIRSNVPAGANEGVEGPENGNEEVVGGGGKGSEKKGDPVSIGPLSRSDKRGILIVTPIHMYTYLNGISWTGVNGVSVYMYVCDLLCGTDKARKKKANKNRKQGYEGALPPRGMDKLGRPLKKPVEEKAKPKEQSIWDTEDREERERRRQDQARRALERLNRNKVVATKKASVVALMTRI